VFWPRFSAERALQGGLRMSPKNACLRLAKILQRLLAKKNEFREITLILYASAGPERKI